MRESFYIGEELVERDTCERCGGWLYREQVQQPEEPDREMCLVCHVRDEQAKLAADHETAFDGVTAPPPEPEPPPEPVE